MSKLTSDEWEQKINQMQSDLSQARKEKAKARRQEIEKFRKDVGKLMTSLYPEYTMLSDFEKAFAQVPAHANLVDEKSCLQDPSESDRRLVRSFSK